MKRFLLCTTLLLVAMSATAAEVTLIAVMGNKAIFSINGQRKTMAVGQSADGIRVSSISSDSAVVVIDGKSSTLQLGRGYVSSTAEKDSGIGSNSLTLSQDESGHFASEITINGRTLRGMIDTGASLLVLSTAQATQMGLSSAGGQAATAQTAGGKVKASVIRIPQIRIGNITLYDVQAAINESNDPPYPLIGMSVLNRFTTKQENGLMILTKKPY
ncbi:retropepsin-like aspartic protease family protein [Chitinilyticum piscinae]|uniref:TIGR02281 family clan AA aspartic protease n=1 Tax=Chitinilyticum piscinae TaxID=2866724 RepID=A0A8J7FMS1_9NEIS|nr:TIGR02281 family clan AA aspartic protease [Chitinilyticum piscinae]MBE9611042.1 TIGR02281 family clan AA aspartic protease [Chitinilyticum piscinae]